MVIATTQPSASFDTTTGRNLSPDTPFGAGDDTLIIAHVIQDGSVAEGGDGTDTLVVTQNQATLNLLDRLRDFENLDLSTIEEVGFAADQLAQFTGTITADGDQILNVFGPGDFATLGGIERFVIRSNDATPRTVDITHGGADVIAQTAESTLTFDIGARQITGRLQGQDDNPDTLRAETGADISDATIADIANLDLSGDLILTVDQLNGFDGRVAAPEDDDAITLASSGTLDGGNLAEIAFIDTAGNGRQETVTLSSATADGKGLFAADAFDGFVVTEDPGDHVINLITGDNVIRAGHGNDTIVAGIGSDRMTGGPGRDEFVFFGADSFDGDTVTDLSATDTITLLNGSEILPDEVRFSDDGSQLLIFPDDPDPLALTLANAAGNDLQIDLRYEGLDAVLSFTAMPDPGQSAPIPRGFYLSGGDDLQIGTAGNDRILAYGGDDIVWAGPDDTGDDAIFGGRGNDILGGGAGDDTLEGGTGHDTLWGGAGADDLAGEAGDDVLGGGAGGDDLDGGDGDDRLYGGRDPGDDTLSAGDGADTLYAGAGADSLAAGAGDDLVFNGDGADTVRGGDGADLLWGGSGDDRLSGDAGADTFGFRPGTGDDTVTDFAPGTDRLRFEGIAEEDVTLQESRDGALLRVGDDSVTLEGIDAASLDPGAFLFG